MPRRKAADRSGPVKTRSRDGCKECRTSRVRCDTKKPRCTRCCEKGLPCTTTLVLKWESEFVSRGAAFGRAGVWNKARPDGVSASSIPSTPTTSISESTQWLPLPTIHPWGFINSGVLAFENSSEVDVKSNELHTLVPFTPLGNQQAGQGLDHLPLLHVYSMADLNGLAAALNPSPRAGPSLFPDVTRMGHGELMDYYLQQVCPRTTASSLVSSPFASVILPFSLSASPALFKAIQALGACHRSRSDASYAALGLRLKSETLRHLRHRLSSEGPSNCCNDPEILVIMMLLCLYEIVDKCDPHWTIHLNGAKDLIRLRRGQAAALSPSSSSSSSVSAPDPATAFAEHFFAFQDVMGRTACAKEVAFGSDYWKADDRRIDLWMGCSPELVSLLCAITDMSRARRTLDSDSSRTTFAHRAAMLERQLEHLVQEIEGDDDEVLASGAEAKRLAAVLYLHCALYSACPTTRLVSTYVRQILQIVSKLLDRGSPTSITWPVFVAAVELDPSQDEIWMDDSGRPVSGRSIVLRALAAMTESTIANIARTRAMIVQLWQTRDQDMLKAPRIEGNDWEWYVVPISDAMSLA